MRAIDGADVGCGGLRAELCCAAHRRCSSNDRRPYVSIRFDSCRRDREYRLVKQTPREFAQPGAVALSSGICSLLRDCFRGYPRTRRQRQEHAQAHAHDECRLGAGRRRRRRRRRLGSTHPCSALLCSLSLYMCVLLTVDLVAPAMVAALIRPHRDAPDPARRTQHSRTAGHSSGRCRRSSQRARPRKVPVRVQHVLALLRPESPQLMRRSECPRLARPGPVRSGPALPGPSLAGPSRCTHIAIL